MEWDKYYVWLLNGLQRRFKSGWGGFLDHLLCVVGTASTTSGDAEGRSKIVQGRGTI
jgi:hypothetical protein